MFMHITFALTFMLRSFCFKFGTVSSYVSVYTHENVSEGTTEVQEVKRALKHYVQHSLIETKALETSGKQFHASHANLFPLLKKADVVSHPVKL